MSHQPLPVPLNFLFSELNLSAVGQGVERVAHTNVKVAGSIPGTARAETW